MVQAKTFKNKKTRVATKNKATKRTVITVYYNGTEVVKVNRSMYANRAVPKCVDHMQFNTYGATHADVYDEDGGILHAAIVRAIAGRKALSSIGVLFKRKVLETYVKAKQPGNAKISREG